MNQSQNNSNGNGNSNNNGEDNPLAQHFYAQNNMMGEILRRRVSEFTSAQPSGHYGDIAALYGNNTHQDPAAAAAALQANNLALAMELNAMQQQQQHTPQRLQQQQQQQQQQRRNSSLMFQEHARRNSSLGLSGLLNDENFMAGYFGTGVSPSRMDLTSAQRRTSLDVLGDTAAAIDLQEKIKRRQSLDSTATSQDQSNHALLNTISNVDSQIMRAEAELVRRRASLQLALQGGNNARNGADLLQQRNSLELALQTMQRRNSLEQAQRRNSLEQAQRRNSLELAQTNLELAQRRASLELAQRRNSLEQNQRRNSSDLLNGRPNDAASRLSLSHILAEQFLSDRRHTLSMGRNSSMQHGMHPIDPRHVDTSLFDDGSPSNLTGGIDPRHVDPSRFDDASQAALAMGLQQSEQEALYQSLRRQSLLQSLGQANDTALQDRRMSLNHQTAGEVIDRRDPAVLQQQVSPFLNAVESLQQKMQKSQQSQKNIQSWDKKMGLKRSHSSTMTKTHRSRKQLKELFETQKKRLETNVKMDVLNHRTRINFEGANGLRD